MKLSDFKLERYFAKYEFNVEHLLCCSDCESFSVDEILALENGAESGLKKLWLGYTESLGHPELRDEISELYEKIRPSETLVFSGAEEAIFAFMHAVLESDDHVIVHSPCYQSLLELPKSVGCHVSKWRAEESNGWRLSLAKLEEMITDKTRAIVLNCPHNPTGYLMAKEDFEAVIDLARRKNIIVFSDEVYRFLEYDQADRLPAACDLYENAVSLGVMSKAFGLAGLRIGWIATRNPAIYQKMAAFKDYTTICNSAPSEWLATLALRRKEKILSRNLKIIRENIAAVNSFFQQNSHLFSWIPPRAGCIGFAGLKNGVSSQAFCDQARQEAGVLLLPSLNYDCGDQHFRIGFGRKNTKNAIEALTSLDFLMKMY